MRPDGPCPPRRIRWRLWLPIFQSLLAVMLWLFWPIEVRKEVLRARHQPTEHPFRYRLPDLPWDARAQLDPPPSGQVFYAINFPMDAVNRIVLRRCFDAVKERRHIALPQLEFNLPVGDSEALPPRTQHYEVHTEEAILLAMVVLFWFWFGSRLDDVLSGRNQIRSRLVRQAQIVTTLSLLAVCSMASYYELTTPYYPRFHIVGVAGIVWCAAMLAYAYASTRAEFQRFKWPE